MLTRLRCYRALNFGSQYPEVSCEPAKQLSLRHTPLAEDKRGLGWSKLEVGYSPAPRLGHYNDKAAAYRSRLIMLISTDWDHPLLDLPGNVT